MEGRTVRYVMPVLAFGFFVCLPSILIAQLSGEWSGTVTQPGANPPTYTVEMILKGYNGSISYPDLQCEGSLTYIRKSGPSFVYREHITSGQSKCIDGGTLTVTPSEDRLDWHWSGGGEFVKGTLRGKVLPLSK